MLDLIRDLYAGAKEILAGSPYFVFNDVRVFDVFYQWIGDRPFYLCIILTQLSGLANFSGVRSVLLFDPHPWNGFVKSHFAFLDHVIG